MEGGRGGLGGKKKGEGGSETGSHSPMLHFLPSTYSLMNQTVGEERGDFGRGREGRSPLSASSLFPLFFSVHIGSKRKRGGRGKKGERRSIVNATVRRNIFSCLSAPGSGGKGEGGRGKHGLEGKKKKEKGVSPPLTCLLLPRCNRRKGGKRGRGREGGKGGTAPSERTLP